MKNRIPVDYIDFNFDTSLESDISMPLFSKQLYHKLLNTKQKSIDNNKRVKMLGSNQFQSTSI